MIPPSIYQVKFSAFQQGAGDGLAIFKDGTINGGDAGYLYLGRFIKNGSAITAEIKVKRWNGSAVSVFGDIQEFDLKLSGEISSNLIEFTVSGYAAQMPNFKIAIQGRRLADAV